MEKKQNPKVLNLEIACKLIEKTGDGAMTHQLINYINDMDQEIDFSRAFPPEQKFDVGIDEVLRDEELREDFIHHVKKLSRVDIDKYSKNSKDSLYREVQKYNHKFQNNNYEIKREWSPEKGYQNEDMRLQPWADEEPENQGNNNGDTFFSNNRQKNVPKRTQELKAQNPVKYKPKRVKKQNQSKGLNFGDDLI